MTFYSQHTCTTNCDESLQYMLLNGIYTTCNMHAISHFYKQHSTTANTLTIQSKILIHYCITHQFFDNEKLACQRQALADRGPK